MHNYTESIHKLLLAQAVNLMEFYSQRLIMQIPATSFYPIELVIPVVKGIGPPKVIKD